MLSRDATPSAFIMSLDIKMRGRMLQYRKAIQSSRMTNQFDGGESVVIVLYSNLCSEITRHLFASLGLPPAVQKLGQVTKRHQSRQIDPSNLRPLLWACNRISWRAGSLLVVHPIRSQGRQSHKAPRQVHGVSTGALGRLELATCELSVVGSCTCMCE